MSLYVIGTCIDVEAAGIGQWNGERNLVSFASMELPSKWRGASGRPRRRAAEHRLAFQNGKRKIVLKGAKLIFVANS